MQCKIKKKEFKHLSDPPESKVVKIVGGEEVEPIWGQSEQERASKARQGQGEVRVSKAKVRLEQGQARRGKGERARQGLGQARGGKVKRR